MKAGPLGRVIALVVRKVAIITFELERGGDTLRLGAMGTVPYRKEMTTN
jgi:hypothetical protein